MQWVTSENLIYNTYQCASCRKRAEGQREFCRLRPDWLTDWGTKGQQRVQGSWGSGQPLNDFPVFWGLQAAYSTMLLRLKVPQIAARGVVPNPRAKNYTSSGIINCSTEVQLVDPCHLAHWHILAVACRMLTTQITTEINNQREKIARNKIQRSRCASSDNDHWKVDNYTNCVSG